MNRFFAFYKSHYLFFNVPLLFLIAEVVFRFTDPVGREPSPLDKDLAELALRPPIGQPALILLGNSSVQLGFDASRIEARLSTGGGLRRVYNFGLAASTIDDIPQAIAAAEKHGIRVGEVVIGLNIYSIDDKIASDPRFPWVRSCAPYVYRYRSLWRRMLKRVLRNNVDADGELGLGNANQEQNSAQRAFTIAGFLREFDHRNPADFSEYAKISVLRRTLQARGVPCHFVLMPVSGEATTKLITYSQFMARLRAAAPGALDLADTFDHFLFRDVGHLNMAGKQKISDELAAWLIAQRTSRSSL